MRRVTRALIRCDLVYASLLALFKRATRGCLPLVKPTESDYTRDTRTNIHLGTTTPLDRQEGPDILYRLSATFARPTQAFEIFGNVFMPSGTLAIPDLSIKIVQCLSQENPSVGGLNKNERYSAVAGYGMLQAKINSQ